jgi:hypothetical protein
MMQQLDQGWPQFNGVFRGRPFDFRFLDNDTFGQLGSSYGPGSHVSVQRTDDQGTRKLEFDVKQDGSVEAEVTTDGKTEKIEAKTFDDFRNMHGEVLKEFGIGGAPRPMIPREPDRGLGRGRTMQPVPNVEPRGKKLGVKVTPVSDDLATYLDLDEGVGLLVREVVEGTLAARMGVKRGDVVVEVDGEPATGTEVIAKALPKQDGAPIDLVVIRKGNRVTLHGAS